MNFIEAKVRIVAANISLATELVSSVFYDLGIYGLVINDTENPDPDMKTATSQFHPTAPGSACHAVTAYFPENEGTARKLTALQKKLNCLEKQNLLKAFVSYQPVDDKDWSEAWKTFFHPEKISRRFVVKPSWRNYTPEENEIVLEIDPGMAFGTGTHPTTRLCLNMIEKYFKTGYSFLDIGTGSGILMLAAAKLGATKITGIDNDETAVEIAEKNMLNNHIGKDTYQILNSDLLQNITETYHLVVANILSETILVLLDDIQRVLQAGGIFIASGIIAERRKLIVEKMKISGFHILETCSQEDWVAVTGQLG